MKFLNNGANQTPGLIVMTIGDQDSKLDPQYRRAVVLFNATTQAQNFSDNALNGGKFALHPVQSNTSDSVVKTAKYDAATNTFSIPPRTTAVFVEGAGAQSGQNNQAGAAGQRGANTPGGVPSAGQGGASSPDSGSLLLPGLLLFGGLMLVAGLGLWLARRKATRK